MTALKMGDVGVLLITIFVIWRVSVRAMVRGGSLYKLVQAGQRLAKPPAGMVRI